MHEGKFIKMPTGQEGNLFLKKGEGVDESEFSEAISVWESGIIEKKGLINEKLEEHKVELNEQQKQVMNLVFEGVGKSLAENGLERMEVSERLVHFVDDDFFENFLKAPKHESGVQLSNLQSVVVRAGETTSNTKLAAVAFHELLHLFSFQKFRYLKEKWHKDLENYFQEINGLSIHEWKNPEIQYFHFLTEAVVEKMTDDFMEGHRAHPLFREDFIILENNFEQSDRLGFLEVERDNNGQKVYGRSFGYRQELENFDKLLNEIYEKNKADFTSKDEVFAVFKKALFTGRILPLARLIEKTRGKGSFAKLAEETKEVQPYFIKL